MLNCSHRRIKRAVHARRTHAPRKRGAWVRLGSSGPPSSRPGSMTRTRPTTSRSIWRGLRPLTAAAVDIHWRARLPAESALQHLGRRPAAPAIPSARRGRAGGELRIGFVAAAAHPRRPRPGAEPPSPCCMHEPAPDGGPLPSSPTGWRARRKLDRGTAHWKGRRDWVLWRTGPYECPRTGHPRWPPFSSRARPRQGTLRSPPLTRPPA